MNKLVRLVSVAAFAFLCSGVLRAQTKHTPSLEESLSLKVIGGARISPDGRFIAYRVRETDWKENAYVRQIWLVNVATGASFQLTRGKKSSDAPEWSPDGRWLAFIGERESNAIAAGDGAEKKEGKDDKKEGKDEKKEGEGKPAARQIWVISPDGGEAWQLTQQKYSDYEVFEEDYRQNQLWVVDAAEGEAHQAPAKARQITHDASLNVNGFAWSPDGKRIAFAATHNPILAFGGDEDIYLTELRQDNAVRKIVALDGPDNDPIFSPNGKQIAFATALAQPYFYYANGHIAVVDVERVLAQPAAKPEDVQDLTAQFDENPRIADWGPDGIYFEGLQKTSAHLFRVNPKTKEIARISAPDAYYLDDVSFTKDFKTLGIAAQDATHMTEVFVSGAQKFAPRQLTDVTAQVKDWNLGSAEVISWKSKDGATIEGILRKPAKYDASKKYPLLVVIHGGPTGISQATLSAGDTYYPIQILMSKGALVLQPNYRGSAGYGAAFRALNVRNLGEGDMWDVMSGVDSLIARRIVDATKLGSMGWSQGGYISAFLTTHTDQFKAISAGAGISDWRTYYVNTDITPFTRQYLRATPWDDPEIYQKTSPMAAIKQAKTPTLIQVGSADKRVPPPNSFELYRGLQDQHVASRLILYTGFGHPITKPKSNRAVMQANLDWFNHYIWGEEFPKDSALLGSSEVESAK